jgi:hypothetical protein
MHLRLLVPLALALGLLFAAGSTFIVRPAADRVIVGLGCAKTDLNPHGLCFASRPRGGFPLIQISDNPDAANRGKLGFEDDLYPVSFAGNVAAFAALWLAALGGLSLARQSRKPAGPAEGEEVAAAAQAEEAAPAQEEPAAKVEATEGGAAPA